MYGVASTVGTPWKLCSGGGEATCHSSVVALQGLPTVFGPLMAPWSMLPMNSTKPRPNTTAEIDTNRFTFSSSSG